MKNLDPIAAAVWTGRSFTHEIDIDHHHRFGTYSTVMAKAQLMRSVIQSLTIGGHVPGYTIVERYLSFGRVEMVSTTSGQHLLLKARSSLPFQTTAQGVLFGSGQPAGTDALQLLLYDFVPAGLSFATAAADQRQINGKRTVVLLDDTITEAGLWPPDDSPDGPPFDQGAADDFGDLSSGVEIERRLYR